MMRTPLIGRIKDPLHGHMNIEGGPFQIILINIDLGDRMIFIIGKVNHQLRNILTSKGEILGSPETHIGMLENKGGISLLGNRGPPHKIGMLLSFRISHFMKGKIGVPKSVMSDPCVRGLSITFLLKDILYGGQDSPPNCNHNQIILPRSRIYLSNNTFTILHLMKDPQ